MANRHGLQWVTQLLNRPTLIAESWLRSLHRRSIEDSADARWLPERAGENHCLFHRGLNAQVDLVTASINGRQAPGPRSCKKYQHLIQLDDRVNDRRVSGLKNSVGLMAGGVADCARRPEGLEGM
jgi:hypothetical protein